MPVRSQRVAQPLPPLGEPGIDQPEEPLDVDFADLAADRPAAFVANLPYNVATPILLTALRSGVFDRYLVMVQREVGERWTASVGDAQFGAVSIKVAALAEATVAARVSRNAFYPVPNVDSVTVRLARHDAPITPEVEGFFGLVDAGFSQRRKRLRNTLASDAHAPTAVEAALTSAGLAPGARAEELRMDDWVRLAAALA